MPVPIRREKRPVRAKPESLFWITLVYLLIVALTGGASRIDVQSLVILKPIAVLACAMALVTLRRSHVAANKWLFAGFAATFVLSIIHLVPMPAAMWRSLPGHQELAEVDTLAGLGPVWRPLTLTPMNGWHALTSLFVPLAMMLLAVQLNRDDLRRFLPVILILGVISGLLGLLQVIGGGSANLYLYRGTNSGTAAGLFANRNHAGLFLAAMLPMLATWAATGEDERTKRLLRVWTALAIGIVLFPMIMVTGSRSGLLLSIAGLIAAIALFFVGSRERSGPRRRLHLIGIIATGLVGAALLGLLTLQLSKAEAVMRLINTSKDSEFRFDIWNVSVALMWKYFPLGSGIGSFVEAYQIIEPAYQLNPSYRNHAHQDLLEVGITFGLPGLILLLIAMAFYCRGSVCLWFRPIGDERSVRIARMAAVVMAMIVIASLADYPLRTPFMTCVFVLLSLWFVEPSRERRSSTIVRSAMTSET